MDRFGHTSRTRPPVVLTVPGLNNSGPGHWQTNWETTRGDCERVDLGRWSSPNRNAWVTRLDAAIREIDGPVILAAHSLGCITVAWWGALQSQAYGWPVTGALLVAPPDCDRVETPDMIGNFGPVPRSQLPFPSILVASRDDPYIFFERAHSMGKYWGSQFVDAGYCGHINADSGLGDWQFGQSLLDRLIDDAQTRAASADPGLPAIRPTAARRGTQEMHVQG
ncbi:alpha/beta hydrolase [Sphingobium sp. V4]|uniref:RBBP9/YdeN family alpha/beta hydrolase n=1 Tax=Sphingobium sp. V4 TaxID=3038927 RepID=UPI0025580A66|nr:alpha/beta hydrolase [Sphingobium sp. V4]WIW88799.1 alpha/beta hydrolase [Sphingobium sp. V4]